MNFSRISQALVLVISIQAAMACTKHQDEQRVEDVLTERDLAFMPCDNISSVTRTFYLLAEIAAGKAITWESSNPDVIAIDQYKIPSYFSDIQAIVKSPAVPTEVVLTARFTMNTEEERRDFNLTVVPSSTPMTSHASTTALQDEDVYEIGKKENTVSGTDKTYYTAGYTKNGVWYDLFVPDTEPRIVDGFMVVVDVIPGFLVRSGSNIYITGTVRRPGGPEVGYWKNGTWIELLAGKTLIVDEKEIISLFEWEGDVYVLGFVGMVSLKPYVDRRSSVIWKNRTWMDFDKPSNAYRAVAENLEVSGCDLNATGYVSSLQQSDYPGYPIEIKSQGGWKNNVWVPNLSTGPATELGALPQNLNLK